VIASHVLREYALLADGERGVIVGPRGEFAWMCFPRWDSESIFSTLIGGAGTFSITPRQDFVWGGYYEPGSLIWRSRWVTGDGIVECREALAAPGRRGRAVILRRIIVQRGVTSLDVRLEPRGGYDRHAVCDLRREDDMTWTAGMAEIHLRCVLTPEARPTADGTGLELRLDLEEGQQRDLVLVLDDGSPAGGMPAADAAWAATEEHWHEEVPDLPDVTIGHRDARHAVAVLAGLTSAGGGMVAAATSSLPERASEGRDYDYRYVWIRDQCYAGQAVARIGPHRLLEDAVAFVRDRLLDDGSGLAPAYTTAAGRVPDERRLGLPGYPGGTDLVGNRVNRQFQLDAFGEALLLFASAARLNGLDADAWRAAEVAADAIGKRWTEPDSGIWEIDRQPWTHSRLTCAAGLRAISRYAAPGEQTANWLSLADAITARASREAVHPTGRWQRSPSDPRPDAALLLAALRGAVPADDPRSVATLDSVARDLTDDGYCYRYRPDERPLGDSDGAFLLCGFWLALALAQRGDRTTAARWFERNRAACGPPGLLSEEFDVRQRQLRGNLPQAFVHALLLETAVELSATEADALGRHGPLTPGSG
jgi:alpha,alpha-trehalase